MAVSQGGAIAPPAVGEDEHRLHVGAAEKIPPAQPGMRAPKSLDLLSSAGKQGVRTVEQHVLALPLR